MGPEHAVILAGGFGSRLRPRTLTCPKALTRVGPYSVLEILLYQLRSAGVSRISLCVSFLGEMITQAIGDGGRFGLKVEYYTDSGLGTAGPLAALPDWPEPALVLNGDILTRLPFADLYQHHIASAAYLTMVVQEKQIPISDDVVLIADGQVRALRRAPRLRLDASAGIYVLSAQARAAIPPGTPFDMPDLIESLIRDGHPVRAYRYRGEWHDIGTPAGLAGARRSFARLASAYLPDQQLRPNR